MQLWQTSERQNYFHKPARELVCLVGARVACLVCLRDYVEAAASNSKLLVAFTNLLVAESEMTLNARAVSYRDDVLEAGEIAKKRMLVLLTERSERSPGSCAVLK